MECHQHRQAVRGQPAGRRRGPKLARDYTQEERSVYRLKRQHAKHKAAMAALAAQEAEKERLELVEAEYKARAAADARDTNRPLIRR